MLKNKVLVLLLVLMLAGGSALTGSIAGGFAVYQFMRSEQAGNPYEIIPVTESISTSNVPDTSLTVSSTDVETAITQTVQAVGPAVVTVVGTVTQTGFNPMFGQQSSQATVSGSGFFISAEGYILTNNHVIEGTDSLQVILSDGSQLEASIVGTDIYSDIAVLKVEGEVPAVARLGNSDLLNPGESVIAIGSPLGNFMNTVTVGVVSATGRSLDTGLGYQIEGLVQTDAAINQGNSGGPLVNLAGEVIGINTYIVRSSGSGTVAEGLGFSIPSNTAAAVAQQIISKGHVTRPYLGISFQSITPEIAAMYRLPVEYGAYITEVRSGSPASKAGLKADDIITAVGGTAIDETHSYLNLLLLHNPGEEVSIDFLRNGKQQQVLVTLAELANQ